MAPILSTENNYKSLSIKDLLQARDLYHYHLLNKANVVGTAIGLYLIRDEETDSEGQREQRSLRKSADRSRDVGKRTLTNSSVRPYSWPCVHAFVKKWVPLEQFGHGRGKVPTEEMIPSRLYMPDGRIVPVCVTEVEPGEAEPAPTTWQWPGGRFGGGMPISVRTQERERVATAGCLVSDGHSMYALTSRHVCGDEGEDVFTLARGSRVRVGHGSRHRLTRLPFTDVYPEFAGKRTFINLDVGLIELDDVNEWTSQFVDLGNVGPLADLNELNISVRLINAPVVAIGAASGRLEGRIKALFYRFRSVGGFDYVSDFLIGPRETGGRSKPPRTHTRPGDSGAVWHLVEHEDADTPPTGDAEFRGTYRPLAVEWGGQVFLDSASAGRFTFALATSLTTVCQALNVELALDHNTGALPYWGQMGHYSIGSFACDALRSGKLKTFLKQNVDQISFDLGELDPDTIKERIKTAKADHQLIPLADVPDLLWKNHKSKVEGGRDTRFVGFRSQGPEHPTHYADIDEPRASDGKTLRQLCMEDDDNIDVAVWQEFYDDAGHTAERDRGLLPFRVWQFFDAMKEFASKKQADKFLCAAGLVSHYVGDACQPLHGSILADGFKDQPMDIVHTKRDTGEKVVEHSNVGAGVHSTYETKMVDRHAEDIVDGLQSALGKAGAAIPAITTGKQAATAIVQLMDRAAKRLPPRDIVDAYVAAGGKPVVAAQEALWDQFGDATIETMADGARVLAKIWQGAWTAGKGNQIAATKLGRVDPDTLVGFYQDRKFVESLALDDIGKVLK